METNDSVSSTQEVFQEEEYIKQRSYTTHNPLSTQDILQKYLDFAPGADIVLIEPLLKKILEQMKVSILNRKPIHSLEKTYPDILKRLHCTFCFLRQISRLIPHNFFKINFYKFLEVYLTIMRQFPHTPLTYIKEDSDLSSFLRDLTDNYPLESKEINVKKKESTLIKELFCMEWVICDIIEKEIELDNKESKYRDDIIDFFINLERILLCQLKERKDMEMKVVNKLYWSFMKILKQTLRHYTGNEVGNELRKTIPVKTFFKLFYANFYQTNQDQNESENRRIHFELETMINLHCLSQSNGIDNQGKCESIQAEVIADENLRENDSLLKAFEAFLLVTCIGI